MARPLEEHERAGGHEDSLDGPHDNRLSDEVRDGEAMRPSWVERLLERPNRAR